MCIYYLELTPTHVLHNISNGDCTFLFYNKTILLGTCFISYLIQFCYVYLTLTLTPTRTDETWVYVQCWKYIIKTNHYRSGGVEALQRRQHKL